jgi:hypothetical protein
MGRPIKTAKTAVNTGYQNGEGLGIVGGNTAFVGTQIKCRVKIGNNAEADGYIIRQKGARKYFVTDGTNFGTCALADKANGALVSGDMTITVTKLDASTARLAKFGDSFGSVFTATPNEYESFYLSFGPAADIPVGGIYEIAQVASL